jgi:hypothetical protein
MTQRANFETVDTIEIWRGSARLFRGRLVFSLDATDVVADALRPDGATLTFRYPTKVSKAYGTLAPIDGTPPATPTGLVTDGITGGYVALLCDDLGDATQWTFYRDGSPVGTVGVAAFTDSTVVPSHANYSYQVQASNAAGSSALSSALLVTTAANSAPVWSFPNQTAILGSGFSITLNSFCDDVDNHALTFSLISGSVPGLSLVGVNYGGVPTAAAAYPLTFRANDGYVNSDTAITFTVNDPDVTAPTVPGSVNTTVTGSTTTTTWSASTDASGILKYRVFRNSGFRSDDSASPYVESGVPDGSYTYAVSAVDASANANESAPGVGNQVTVAVTPPAPDTPIYAPITVISTSQLNSSWTAGPSGPTPTSYELDRSLTGTSGWSNRFTGLAFSFNDTGLSANTQYFYRLRAFSSITPSASYATRSATTLSVATGTVLAGDDWEGRAVGYRFTGTYEPMAFGAQCRKSNSGADGLTIPVIVSSPVYRGARSVKFNIPGNSTNGSSAWFRSEMETEGYGVIKTPNYQNVEQFVGFALYLDPAFPVTDANAITCVLMQQHIYGGQPGASPIWGLRIRYQNQYWLTTEAVGSQTYNIGRTINADRGVWRRWVFHVKYNDAGLGWVKTYGGASTGVLSLLHDTGNITTVPPGTTQLGFLKVGGGLYAKALETRSGSTRTAYSDGFRVSELSVGGNLALVDPASY